MERKGSVFLFYEEKGMGLWSWKLEGIGLKMSGTSCTSWTWRIKFYIFLLLVMLYHVKYNFINYYFASQNRIKFILKIYMPRGVLYQCFWLFNHCKFVVLTSRLQKILSTNRIEKWYILKKKLWLVLNAWTITRKYFKLYGNQFANLKFVIYSKI